MQTVQPMTTFKDLLFARDRELYSKWFKYRSLGSLYITFTAKEKDLLTCLAIQARKMTNHKG